MTDSETLPGPGAPVSLREITRDNLRDILRLEVAEAQSRLVAGNDYSLAQALFHKEAWYRAIYAGETPVGFLMLSDNPITGKYFLWRLMVDQRFQGRGFARQAVALLVDYVSTRPGATELLVSHMPGEGNPGPFYERLGFQYTGQMLHQELVMSLPLESAGGPAAAEQSQPLVHVVLFRLHDRSPGSIARTAALLRGMEGKIPLLQELEIGTDVIHAQRSYDIALIARFASLADMEAYQAHPIHQDILAHMRQVTESSVAVDFRQ